MGLKQIDGRKTDWNNWKWSRYKNEEGLITTNGCGNVLEYQKRLSVVDWKAYHLSGTAAQSFVRKERSQIGRVVEETTRTTSSLVGMGLTAALSATLLILYSRHMRVLA